MQTVKLAKYSCRLNPNIKLETLKPSLRRAQKPQNPKAVNPTPGCQKNETEQTKGLVHRGLMPSPKSLARTHTHMQRNALSAWRITSGGSCATLASEDSSIAAGVFRECYNAGPKYSLPCNNETSEPKLPCNPSLSVLVTVVFAWLHGVSDSVEGKPAFCFGLVRNGC